MQTYLRHGVHLCLIDEGAIFLDLSANAYLGIDAATKRALTTCLVGLDMGRAGEDSDQGAGLPNQVATLLARGLLTSSASLGRSFSPLTIRMTDALPYGTGRAEVRIRALHVVRFLRALLRASTLIRRGRLLQLAATLQVLRAQIPSASATDQAQGAIALVHIARRLATLFYTSREACLLDSMVLGEFLIRHGHRAKVMLGVRTKPFSAHAWVQLETHVLNDSLEHAQTLIPIAEL